jgi:hypothetical protein
MHVSDLNCDGIPDVIFYENGALAVSIGNGDGTFQPTITSPSNFGQFVIADFNNDGNPDIVAPIAINVVGYAVLLGNGDGTFQNPVNTVVNPSGTPFSTLASGDFNHDGNIDFVITGINMIQIYLGNGDGTFTAGASYTVSDVVRPSVVIGDLNADGFPDIIFASSGTIWVMMNNSGTFANAVNYVIPATNSVSIPVVADLNSDGKPDLAIGAGNTVCVLFGNGDGTLQPQNGFTYGIDPNLTPSLAIADFNGDGIPDIAIVTGGSTIAILNGAGDGSFQTSSSFSNSSFFASDLTVADFNGDGLNDFATDGLGISSLLFQQTATFSVSGISVTGTTTFNVAATYSDLERLPLTSNSVTLTGKPSPTITLASSANPVLQGSPLTLAASLSGSNGVFPTGTISFFGDSGTGPILLGSANISGSSAAIAINLTAGKYTLSATYGGDSNFANGSSNTLSQTVNAVAASVSLASSLNPSTFGQQITLTATVINPSQDGKPSGSVSFFDNGIPIGVSQIVLGRTGGVGTAVLVTTALQGGPHQLVAANGGDTTNESAPLTQVVNQVAATLSLVSSYAPSTYGDAIIFLATISPGATGSITFTDGSTTLGTAPIVSGIATFTPPLFAAGTHSVTATYSGDANFF